MLDEEDNDMIAGPHTPYYGLWQNGQPLEALQYNGDRTVRAQWPIYDTKSLAILSIRLDGIPLCGDTSTIVHNYLAPYYREQPILFQELTYDLNEGMKVYEHAIRKIIMQIEKFAPGKIIIFLTTHVTPEEGLIHIARDGAAAADAEEVLPHLIPANLQKLVKGADTSLLFLLTCGALNSTTARDIVAKFVQNAGFKNAFGFTIARFLPAAATTFLQETAMAFCLTSHAKKFSHILATHYELGIHTDVIAYFGDGTVYRYSWSHPANRPYGHPVRQQCSDCSALSSWKVKVYTSSSVTLRCAGCEKTRVFQAPKGFMRIDNKPWDGRDRSVQGVWYGEWLIAHNTTRTTPPCFT
ncbi:hypothetical protein B0H13DRAFT_1927324 [Mycena leptocephala]|nr:hypothetical protein B0H13DRAFT_1927324 [Mycena leptocephala]